ncbi:MAG: ABC transporter ATP-binding protein [Elusimicrobiaceae bacterium]|nr:ABC transporter ATP-binding protein [Elusimicrobiaceae bacterium]
MGILRARNLCFAYSAVPVLKNVSFRLEKGAFLAVTGPNGSGKSTLLKLLAGLLAPQSGEALLKGTPVAAYSPRARASIAALVPASMQMPFDFTVYETVFMGRAPKMGWWGGARESDSRAVESAILQLGLASLRNRAVNSLSSGEQQKVFIAQALAQEPEILFLDEPTSHLDITCQTGVFELLESLSESGVAIVAVTHDIALAARYCNEILLLKDGSVYAQGSPAAVITETALTDVYGIRAELRHAKAGISIDIIGTSDGVFAD